jgi:cytochrome c553
MMSEHGVFSWRNPWFRWSVGSVSALTVLSVLIGFIWLPSVHADFTAQGLWASICRAAGVPDTWIGEDKANKAGPVSTSVVLDRGMGRSGTTEAIGRGATLAWQCTMCHGAQGVTVSDAPNLAGQYAEVLVKQLQDYKRGNRSSAIMQALTANLSDSDINDLAAYYAYLPRIRTAPARYTEDVPALVRVGDPMRNIAPCISCHGGIDQKLGTPWLEGMPAAYLVTQLKDFASGARRNDSHAQMRNMARAMTPAEIDVVAEFYARPGEVGGHR